MRLLLIFILFVPIFVHSQSLDKIYTFHYADTTTHDGQFANYEVYNDTLFLWTIVPCTTGCCCFDCKFWTGHTHEIWHRLNVRLVKWVRWEKDLSTRAAIRYLKVKYKEKPCLFPHWKLVHP